MKGDKVRAVNVVQGLGDLDDLDGEGHLDGRVLPAPEVDGEMGLLLEIVKRQGVYVEV